MRYQDGQSNERSLPAPRAFLSTAVVLLGCVASGAAAHGQTPTFPNPRDLLNAPPAAFVELMQAARPRPMSVEDLGRIVRSLPATGEVTSLDPRALSHLAAVRQILRATNRDWYEVKVIDVPQAAIALHARAVLLISKPVLNVVTPGELQALAAHEIGHEYVWAEYEGARRGAGQTRLKELELLCDAMAAVTLHDLGLQPSSLVDGITKISRFNRDRFGAAANEAFYPTVAERMAFAGVVQRWLRHGR